MLFLKLHTMRSALLSRAVVVASVLACCKQTAADPVAEPASSGVTKQPFGQLPRVTRARATSPEPTTKDSTARADTESAKAPYPVKWSTVLELPSLNKVDDKLRAEGGFGVLEYGGQQIEPKNCLEWAELHRKGAAPPTSLAEADDGTAKERCGSLDLLRTARGSNSTFVRTLPWNRELLPLLPAAISTAWSPEARQEVKRATAAGLTFDRLDSKATARRAREPESLEITTQRGASRIYLYPTVWADLNSDGIEELVLSVRNVDAAGSMTQMRLLVTARSSTSEPPRTRVALTFRKGAQRQNRTADTRIFKNFGVARLRWIP